MSLKTKTPVCSVCVAHAVIAREENGRHIWFCPTHFPATELRALRALLQPGNLERCESDQQKQFETKNPTERGGAARTASF
jgi:hypothetical protein